MIDKLVKKIKETKAPIVVGLDPMLSYVPEYIKKTAFDEYGETLEGAAEAIWQYNKGIVDAVHDLIPAVKPQIAMYEQFGIEGLKAFQKTVDYCKSKDLVVIADIKRGDIGSTSAAYAVGHLGKVAVGSKTYSAFGEDFATVNPYLGTDGIKPFYWSRHQILHPENSRIVWSMASHYMSWLALWLMNGAKTRSVRAVTAVSVLL